MCTVTITTTDSGFWMVSNRDEHVNRPAAMAPKRYDNQGHICLYPIDPEGGGSWIGANASGLAAALLNYYPSSLPESQTQWPSRGSIVIEVLRNSSAELGIQSLLHANPQQYQPFTLVLMDRNHQIRTLSWDGKAIREDLVSPPAAFISSGFDQSGAEHARLGTFSEWLTTKPAGGLSELLHYHRDVRHQDGAINVLVDKTIVQTLSITALHIQPSTLQSFYFAPPDNSPIELSIPATLPAH